ncbi:MAG: 50S ribosomal protein L15 [Candidatus Aerophobetes bacterium]|nr:50S ribosomal protein L15 [Candidatus Aerophobetes bacterium]
MDLSIFKFSSGATHKKKRVGRGRSSGHGKTSCRGQKGQKAHSKVAKWFEGGQMPLVRRVPKRGFNKFPREKNQIINLEDLNIFKEGEVVTPEVLKDVGLVKKRGKIKILARGSLHHPLKVRAHGFSKEAQKKIEEAKGTVEVI